MILRWPSSSKKPGVAGMEPALGVDHLGRRIGPLVVFLEQQLATHQHLAVVGDLDLDPGAGLPTLSNLISRSGCRQTAAQVSVGHRAA
jgi:hypothetical protein